MLISSLGSRNLVTRSSRRGGSSSRSGSGKKGTSFQRGAVRDFMGKLVDAGKSVQKLRTNFSEVRATGSRKIAARTVGASRVEIITSSTASTLTSTEELSTHSTAVSDRAPEFSESRSTAEVTIHGTYTGTSDAEYEIRTGNRRGFQLGSNKSYRMRVYKNGSFARYLTISKKYSAGTELNLDRNKGLTVSFTTGYVTKKDSATTDGLTGVDVKADSSAAFNSDDTFLDSAVTAGSFEINGTTITVQDDDSIDSVVDTINTSGAGVRASYQSSSDTLTLTHSTKGANTITVGSDTSGFLAAMKLDSASTSVGVESERTQALADVGEFSDIQSGSFDINGETITIDVATDSLNDIIDRVKASDAGVRMAYSNTTDRLTIRNGSTDEVLTVENDTTGLFETFGVEAGESEGTISRGVSSRVIRDMTTQITEMMELINQMAVSGTNESSIDEGAKKARNQLRKAIREELGGGSDTIDSGFGFHFNVAEDGTGSFIELDSGGERELARALRRNPSKVLETLFGSDSKDGVLQAMLTGLDKAQKSLTNRYGSVGIMLDTTA